MKKSFLIIIFCSLILGCKSEKKKTQQETDQITTEIIVDSLKESKSIVTADFLRTTQCDCQKEEYNRKFSADLFFQNIEHSKANNDSLFTKWSDKSLVNEIKSLRFAGFDTIPEKYSIFKEVNKISIDSRNGIYGLDIFPKLKTIHFFGSVVNLNSGEKWISKIEALFGQKTKFIGLESFSEMSNLNVIDFGFSGFDKFPKDLDKLKCLNELTFGAYMYGKIDLSWLNLSKNRCLRKVQFQCWQNTLSGLPKGLDNSNIRELKIHHQKLSELEKEELKRIKASR